jgi:hypothetical protein
MKSHLLRCRCASAPHVQNSTLRCGRTGGFARRANITRADRVGPVRLASDPSFTGSFWGQMRGLMSGEKKGRN